MNNALTSFLHLIKRGGVLKLGSPYLTLSNKAKIKLILVCETASENTKEISERYALTHNIPNYFIAPAIMDNLYPTKNVKVLSVTSREAAVKIANLMKEGDPYE